MVSDYYAVFGVERDCEQSEIRGAFRLLVKQWHPDRNGGSEEAAGKTRELNEAYDVLGDPERRRDYDRKMGVARSGAVGGRAARDLKQDVLLSAEELILGTTLTIRVDDPANADGEECYRLVVPEGTAVGERFRVAREGAFVGGVVVVRVKMRPGFQFKARGVDLKTELRISAQRAKSGGGELVAGPTGGMVRVAIPAGVARDAVVAVPGEGLPKPRGGRGDLLVKVKYRVAVDVRRGGKGDGAGVEDVRRLW